MIKSQQPIGLHAMTLMETVIAIGVIAFAVPLVLTATAAGLSDRRNAESETRAAWIATDVSRQVAGLWKTPPLPTYLPGSLTTEFPVVATESSPWVLLYDNQGKFIEAGQAQDLKSGSKKAGAVYLAAVHGVPHTPGNLQKPTHELSRLSIKIQQPARAPLEQRQSYPFTVILPKIPPY